MKKTTYLLSSLLGLSLLPNSPLMADNNIEIEEVIVTATRRAQDLQEIPVSVSAFSGELLDKTGIASVREIARQTPGFTSAEFNKSNPTFVVRGANNTFSQAGASKPVGVFLDDVYISRIGASSFDLFDIEQVAVLRGPQGTLFGRNVTGGAVQITTAKPSLEDSTLKFEIGAGNYDAIDVRGLISGALSDTVAGKLSFTNKTADGYGDDLRTGDESDDVDSFNIRAQLLFAPSDTSEYILTVDYSEDDNGGRTLSSTSIADDGDPRTSNLGTPQGYEREQKGISLRAEWDLGFGSLQSITAWRESDSDESFNLVGANFADIPPHPLPFLFFLHFQDERIESENPEVFTQEIRFVSEPGEVFDYVVGLYYFQEEIDRLFSSRRLQAVNGNVLRNRQWDQEVETTSYAVYGDIQFHLTDTIDLNIGSRYTYDEKDADLTVTDVAGLIFQADESEDWDQVTSRVSLTWQVSNDINLFASWTEGFTSGGFNTEADAASTLARPFDEERVTAIELGAKTQWFDDRLTANLTLFEQTYRDKQEAFFDRVLFAFSIFNAAEATVEGYELELSAHITDQLSVNASYAYLNTKYDEFLIPGTTDDRSGNELGLSPENSYSLSIDYTQPLGDAGEIFFNAGYSYQDDYQGGSENLEALEVDGYGLTNLTIGYQSADEHWRITGWIKNLEDKEYALVNSSVGPVDAEYLGPPRTYGVRVTYTY